MVVAMLDSVSMFRRIIDDMPMDNGRSRVRLVQVLRRQYRQRQHGGERAHGHDESDESGL